MIGSRLTTFLCLLLHHQDIDMLGGSSGGSNGSEVQPQHCADGAHHHQWHEAGRRDTLQWRTFEVGELFMLLHHLNVFADSSPQSTPSAYLRMAVRLVMQARLADTTAYSNCLM